MIPSMNITAWSTVAPWPAMRQIEQDLIISRALVDIFSDTILAEGLRFRGGTALNKLHFPKPLRYSEDIDLVRTTSGGIGALVGRLRDVLHPWLGAASFDQSNVAPKLRFRVPAEDGSGDIRLKLEINTREIDLFDPPNTIAFAVENPWFTGSAGIATFSREELLATKLRALLQRNKGRDLFDLAYALKIFPQLNTSRIVEVLGLYLNKTNTLIGRAEAEKRMFAKLAQSSFVTDIGPLLSAGASANVTEGAVRQAFVDVFRRLIVLMPGAAWAKTPEMLARFGFADE